ncbi:MAG: hypothetical protein GF308_18045 [Candidatus Heimdallarchaeota archaeon]|nr:hypothetical protein [Candidatus Heimdallarchaeota archaeon]
MPFFNFRGSRESQTVHSEIYKEIVLDFFYSKDYIKQSDSALEGHLSDLILKNPHKDGEIETHVEIKWTNFSLNNENIRKEFTQYLLLYCRAPQNKKFKFYILARNVVNLPFHKSIFEKNKASAIKEICEKIKTDLEGEDLSDFKEFSKGEDIKEFFWDTYLIQANVQDLKLKIRTITGDYPLDENPFSRYKNLLDEENILNDKESLISNLVRIQNFTKIYIAQTRYRRRGEVYNNIPHPSPFLLHEGKLISLYPFNGNNPLNGIINERTIEEIQVSEWLKNEDKRRLTIKLLNKTGERLLRLRGLYQKIPDYIYYFPDHHREGEKELEWDKFEIINGKETTRTCRRRIFKKYAERSKNPYYLHIAVEFRAFYFDKKLFYIILPKKVFTSDGKKTVSSRRARRLDEKFRNPQWSYNRNVLLEQLFWAYIIFRDPKIFQKKIYYTNSKNEEITKNIHIILQILGLDNNYKNFIIGKRPKIEETIEDDEESISKTLDSIFQIQQE